MRIPVALGVLVAAASAALVAQSSSTGQSDSQPRPTFRTEANYIRVDMYATSDGRSVEDLKPEEIEILEDGVPQKLDAFEFVHVRPAGPQESRIEPNTVEESRQLAQDPRARVFVIFLDTYHVQVDGSHRMRQTLVQFLDRVLGQDDLVAIMTPEMSAAGMTFGRKTTVISKMMQEDWNWGRRDTINLDPKEERYDTCYPQGSFPGIADEMIERRREKLSIDALEDLVYHLRGLREERKAVLTVSEGWRLFPVNMKLAGPIKNETTGEKFVPGGPEPIYVGPDGKLRHGADPREVGATGATMRECDADRIMLAQMENSTRFRYLFDQANRGNVSFYTIYPRGLAVFDSPIGPRRPPPPAQDARNLTARHNSLRELAENTDGLAIVNREDIDGAMTRVIADLTSYYLLGYYSSNTKLDGKFREIKVRVKRPGIDVRARRGYRGATAEDLTSAADDARRKGAESVVSKAMAVVAGFSPRSLFRLRASSWTSQNGGDKPAAAMWLVGELDYSVRKDIAWSAGAIADISVISATGEEIETKKIDVGSKETTFTLRVPESGGVVPGEYAVRIRVKPNQEMGVPLSDTARVIVPEQPARVGEALIWRRGPTTGPKYMVTADPRFQRSDRIRLEHATTAAGTATARMLDKLGNPIKVPVQVSDRQDESGEFRWIIAESALAPLAPGDYAIELMLDETKVVTGFRVVP